MHAHVTSSARCEACSHGLLVGRSPPQALEAGQPQHPAQMLVALDSGCPVLWLPWALVALDSGCPGLWLPWALVALDSGCPGLWLPWTLVALGSGCCSTSVRASLWGQLSSSMIAAAVARNRGKR